jgi:hypothetical protein
MYLTEARDQLVNHPLYAELNSPERAKLLMKHHAFAVWDFFSLLKRLQREVSCLDVPWTPSGTPDHGRFITEIVLAEECDEDIGEGYISHFELYLRAMDEVGADRGPIDGFIERMGQGQDALEALRSDDIPATVREFVTHTLTVAREGEPHEVASSFCHGRENLLPDVLGAVQDGLGESIDSAPVFTHYLERHITLDHDEHGPLALKLLAALCDHDVARIQRAEEVAVEAIEARSRLWDGVLAEIREREAATVGA